MLGEKGVEFTLAPLQLFVLILQSSASDFPMILVDKVLLIDFTHTFAPFTESGRFGLILSPFLPILLLNIIPFWFSGQAIRDFFTLVYLVFHDICAAITGLVLSASVCYALDEIQLILIGYRVSPHLFVFVEILDMVIDKVDAFDHDWPFDIYTDRLTFFKLALINLVRLQRGNIWHISRGVEWIKLFILVKFFLLFWIFDTLYMFPLIYAF